MAAIFRPEKFFEPSGLPETDNSLAQYAHSGGFQHNSDYLPAQDADCFDKSDLPLTTHPLSRPRRVGHLWRTFRTVLVEDKSFDGRRLTRTLNEIGINRIVNVTTLGALRSQLSGNPNFAPHFIIINADANSPHPYQVLSGVRRHRDSRVRAIPIIVLSDDYHDEARFKEYCRLGISAYLRKPIGVDALRRALIYAQRGWLIERSWGHNPHSRDQEKWIADTILFICRKMIQKYFSQRKKPKFPDQPHIKTNVVA